jgi:hypothetical protein
MCFEKLLGRVFFFALGKAASLPSVFFQVFFIFFAECPKKNTWQTTWHSAKNWIPVVNYYIKTRMVDKQTLTRT